MKKHSSPNSHPSSLANRIRLARQNAGFSQAELADHTGVTPSAVTQWENPHGTLPGLGHLVSIVTATKVSLDWLVMGRGAHRSSKKPRPHVDPPALVMETFAHDLHEETVLSCMRTMTPRARDLLASLVLEWGKGRRLARRQHR
ncbi:helix-turn-helix transcriptional regulator [Dokdonella soli]|uniref:helix-turn-helix domain-containing protein n=1 Tax=Dokdonella soli TaxID=529810 RepID=UPI0031DCCC6F